MNSTTHGEQHDHDMQRQDHRRDGLQPASNRGRGLGGSRMRRIPTEFEKRVLPKEDRDFTAWVRSQPENMWSKFDLSACKLGWVASREFYNATALADSGEKRMVENKGAK